MIKREEESGDDDSIMVQEDVRVPHSSSTKSELNNLVHEIDVKVQIGNTIADSSELSHMIRLSTIQSRTGTLYQCPYDRCAKVFTRPFNLKSHYIAEHTNERPHQCEFCELNFVRSHDLKRHVRTKHEANSRLKCPVCDKDFARKDAMTRHLYPKDGNSPCGLTYDRMRQEED